MIKSNPSDHQYLSYERNTPQTSDITRLQALEKKQETLWQSIRENVSDAKKEFKKLNQQLKEELNNKLRVKAEVVEEILRTLDSKIQFVIESCEKYGNRIMQHINTRGGSEDSTNSQAYSQKFELITEKMRVLEQRLFGFKQNEEQLKSRLEILKDKNNQLTEDYRMLTIRSNERINQLEHQIRQKDHQLKEKAEELRKRENNEAIKFTFVQPQPPPQTHQTHQQMPVVQTQPPSQMAHKTKSQQSSGVTHYNPQLVQQQQNIQQQKKQNIPKTVIAHNPTQYQPKPIQAQPFVDNNSIQIRPEFFRNNAQSAASKGINLRSIRQENLMSARKPLRENQSEMSQSQYHQRAGNFRDNRETGARNQQHDHRFDYLMSNLVATQADSNNTQMTEDSRITSRVSGYQSSYMYR